MKLINNDRFIQFLGLVKRAGKLIEGYNKCEDAIKRNKVHLIVLSLDASKNTIEKFSKYSEKYKVPVLQGYSKEALGNALGLEEIKIVGISDIKMVEKLISLWEQIEKI
ncbi:50S ribosomal protein L7ae-like protein [Clostridium sp. DJ247]|nr:50S ribosomal protein L7ae-like protein [Clostridium sp. DJ247]